MSDENAPHLISASIIRAATAQIDALAEIVQAGVIAFFLANRGNRFDRFLTHAAHRAHAESNHACLTKRMAEEMDKYLHRINIKSKYIHSEVDTLERIEILRELRLGYH